MMTINAERARSRPITLGALALAVMTTAGCAGTEAPEPAAEPPAVMETTEATRTPDPAGTAGSPVYDGPYDEALRAELSDHAGQQVRLRGEVSDLIRSRSAYVITAPGAPDVAPLLVSARYTTPEVEEGTVVEVTGTVRENFELPTVEEATGGEDESGFYAEHVGEPYLDEATVDRAP